MSVCFVASMASKMHDLVTCMIERIFFSPGLGGMSAPGAGDGAAASLFLDAVVVCDAGRTVRIAFAVGSKT